MKEDKWSQASRHLMIRETFKNKDIFNNLQKMSQSIADFLIESATLKSENQFQIKENLNNLFLNLKGIKKMIKEGIENQFASYLALAQKKGPSANFIFIKQIFYLRLLDKV